MSNEYKNSIKDDIYSDMSNSMFIKVAPKLKNKKMKLKSRLFWGIKNKRGENYE